VETAGNLSVLQTSLGGRYVIERELGRGGMATVYLVRDLRHHRLVALKVLHAELGAVLGAERFLKEIELTASLQHPHILPLFDSGEANGLLYYVMPLVEGETLRARLTREIQLPVDDAIRIAQQTAAALDYAHRHGVVHRDIKPENLLLHEGQVQVADFGIALAVQQVGHQRLTQTGLSLGTPQYMAPEQAMGDKTIDTRADVYALGAVTYEMLAGEPPFTGPSAQAIAARVLTEEPKSLRALRRTVPVEIDAAVRRALEKLPADRFSSAAAFASAIGQSALDATAPGMPAAPAGVGTIARSRRQRLLVVGAAAIIAGAVALGWGLARLSSRPVRERRPVRFTIELDSGTLRFSEPAISPDGRTIVFAAEGPDGTRLYARGIDEVSARPLPGTENAELPFFSPNGDWVAFHSNDALRKIRLDGQSPSVIAEIPHGALVGGATWGPDDVIYYALAPVGSIHKVPAGGGTPARVPVADSTLRLLAPHLLPDRTALLVSILEMGINVTRIGVLDLETGRVRDVASGMGARYVDGALVYLNFGGLHGELFRQPFDVVSRTFTADAERLATGIAPIVPWGHFGFDVSASGAFVALVGRRRFGAEHRSLTIVDRTGRIQREIPARAPWEPRFSPDGTRIAYGAYPAGHDSTDVWITDLASGATQRLTTDTYDNNDPVWSPDGRSIVYDKLVPRGKDLYVQPVDGGPARRLSARLDGQYPTDWLADGSGILFMNLDGAGGSDVLVQPLDGGDAKPYLTTSAVETGARVSPDGRWAVYQSDETGRDEIYVQSFPSPGRKAVVSAGGGVNPVWGRDGQLYYWKVDQLMVARVDLPRAGGSPVVASRTVLFRAPYVENIIAAYDVSPDGKQFAVVASEPRPGRLLVALDAVGANRASARPGR